MHTKFFSESLKGRDHVEHLEVDGEDSIKTDIRQIGWEAVACIHVAQDNKPLVSIKGGEFLD